MLAPSFNKKIRKIIEILSYPMYVVVRDEKLKCACRDINSVPNPNCMKCLGTGCKIKIKKILGVMEPDENTSMRLGEQRDKTDANYYYFDTKKVSPEDIKRKNIIVREDEADILMTPRQYRSDSNNTVYYYARSIPMKTNKDLFLRNFYRLVKK